MTVSTDAPPPTTHPDPLKDGTDQHQTRRLIHRLHFFAGIVCAPLILFAAITGLFYAFSPTIEQISNHDMLTASESEARAEGDAIPVSQLVETAQNRHPDLALAGVRLGDADQTTRVLFSNPDLPESTVQAVFMDPYTGEVKGDTTQYGSSASLPMRQWISEGHRMAWLGEPGRLYSETAASWLGVLAVGGFVLLWSRQRGSSRVRGMLRTGGSGRVKTVRRHGATGTIIAAGLVFLTITGLTWSSVAGDNIGKIRENLNWGTPAVSAELPGAGESAASENAGGGAHAGHEGHGSHSGHSMSNSEVRISGLNAGSIDRVAATAERDLRTPVTITPPAEEGQVWTATENRTAYRLSNDSVAIDWATGAVTDRLNFSDWPLAAQATAWLIQLHMGTLFGLPNQIILGLLAAGIIAMICWGYAMWWKRRPKGSLAAAPRRAQWARPTRGTVILVVALVAYGFLAPVFGVSCLAFVAVSAVWSLFQQRRAFTPNEPR
jgi:uncharacterized iron-regulated membrane protein